MKKFLYIAIIGILIWSCGGDGDDLPPKQENKAPSTPTLLKPINEENDLKPTCIDPNVLFEWSESIDSDGDKVYYTIEVSKQSDFSTIDKKKENVATTSTVITIEKGTKFYWRVKATDNLDESDFSSTFKIYTEGDGVSNVAPFSPELTAPDLGKSVQTDVTLEWTASDYNNDALTYDIYLDTNIDNINTQFPVVIPKATQTTNSYTNTTLLNPSTIYYWKIVVNDNKGGKTIGQVWNFVTK
jgi:hypothetical protein